ncbi:MAG TPA: hypothetical protein VH640_07595 [Bryobacteraceae bacterium]|jgi:hypothetical protein
MTRAAGVFMMVAGCITAFAADSPTKPTPTFAKDVAPILQEKCQECHRQGSMAPMSLVTYEETRPWAKAIRLRVVTRQMPPWHIDKNVGVRKFKNDISLSDAQIATIAGWVDGGAPLGDPKDMPPPKKWSNDNEWRAAKDFGPPDLVVKSENFTMPAHHQDMWLDLESPVQLPEDRWVRVVEMRPGTVAGRKITHHAISYIVQNAPANAINGDVELSRRAMLMEWGIGKGFDAYRPNTGKLMPHGSRIAWDLHIHAVGEEITDHVELGVWFYPKGQQPKYETHTSGLMAIKGTSLDIRPNSIGETQNYTVLKQPTRIESFQPHMHLRGKAMEVEAILPNGTSQIVSYVPNFNFNWMNNYIYADDAAPVFPKGTVIRVTAWYDNTRANPYNPDPDQWVGYGHRTVDEMGHAWMNMTYLSDEEYNAWVVQQKNKDQSSAAIPGSPRQ